MQNTLAVKSIESTNILSNQTPRNWHQKETIYQADGIAVVNGKIEQPIQARFFMGRSNSASIVFCAVSISTNDLSTRGHGQAGGYGYDRCSAALDNALLSANVQLSRSIRGTGESRAAILAIVDHLYPKASDTTVLGAP